MESYKDVRLKQSKVRVRGGKTKYCGFHQKKSRQHCPTISCHCVLLILAAITSLLKSTSSAPSSYHKGDMIKQCRHKKNICVTPDGVGKHEGRIRSVFISTPGSQLKLVLQANDSYQCYTLFLCPVVCLVYLSSCNYS